MRWTSKARGIVAALGLSLGLSGACSAPPPVVRQGPSPSLCDEGKVQTSLVPVVCSPSCDGFRLERKRCVNSSWQALSALEPQCQCTPTEVPATLRDCLAEKTVITPSEGYPSDRCRLLLRCGSTSLDVACDAEQDGTGTSLCDCQRDRVTSRALQGKLLHGENIGACYAAAEACLNERK